MKFNFGLFVLTSVLSLNAAAAEVAVMPVQGTNITDGEAQAIGVLLANAYARNAGVDVLGPVDAAKALEQSGNAAAAASQLGVREYLGATALRLANKVTVKVTLYRADGAAIHNAEMTAASLDDMEQVTDRIALALVNRTSVEQSRKLANVTKTEAQARNRMFAEKVWGFKTAFIQPLASNQEFKPHMTLQADWRFEGESYFLEFGAGIFVSSGAGDGLGYGGVFTEIGGSYYLRNDSISPYIGVGVSPRIFGAWDDVGLRLAPYGQFGLMFMRESSTRLYAELRVTQNVIPFERKRDSYFYESTSKKKIYPTEIGVQVGIGW